MTRVSFIAFARLYLSQTYPQGLSRVLFQRVFILAARWRECLTFLIFVGSENNSVTYTDGRARTSDVQRRVRRIKRP